MHRLFVAIRPPEPIRDLLIDAMDDSADFRWQNEDQLHLTLRFIGEVDRPLAQRSRRRTRRIRVPAFDLRISGVGRFEQRNAGALWAGVEPRERRSRRLPQRSSAPAAVGLEAERRAFHPHITLARWKGRRSHEVAAFP